MADLNNNTQHGSSGSEENTEASNASVDPRWSEKDVFTTGEAAQVCNVSQQTIIRCFDSGRLNGFRVPGSRFRRIPREDLMQFMRENRIPLEAIMGSADAGQIRSEKPRVLIVDDERQIVEVLVAALEADGRYEVRVATTGYDAGMLTESFRPDLIILDYMLPDINGNVVCEQLRSRPQFRDTKVLFVSGVVGAEEVDNLLKSGADGFMRKPFDLRELSERVDTLLGERAVGGEIGKGS